MPILQTNRARRGRLVAATTAALLLLATLVTPALADQPDDGGRTQRGQAIGRIDPGLGAQLAEVRAATAKYHDVEVALADGYLDVSRGECVGDETGAMGIHYVKPGNIGSLDPTAPAALLYLPGPDGVLRLVGVEYISPMDPEDPGATPAVLFGQTFADGTPFGPSSGLHVWLWQANPAGMFTAFNPSLSCPAS